MLLLLLLLLFGLDQESLLHMEGLVSLLTALLLLFPSWLLLFLRSTTAVLAAFAPVAIAPAVAIAAEEAIEVATFRARFVLVDVGGVKEGLLFVAVSALAFPVPPLNQLLCLSSGLAVVFCSSKEVLPNPDISPVVLLEEPIEMPVMIVV